MTAGTTRVPVWGFSEADLALLPDSFTPVRFEASGLATAEPLLVHVTAIREYQQAVDRQARGRELSRQALLYLPSGATIPPDAWRYFRAMISEGEWEKLKRIVDHPELLAIVQWARELPVSGISDARVLIESVDTTSEATNGLTLLPGRSDELRRHLSTCETCRQAFLDVLRERQSWSYEVSHPTARRLGAFAHGGSEAVDVEQLIRHLASCPICAAKVQVLKRIAAPRWQEVTLNRLSSVVASAEGAARNVPEWLAGMLEDFAKALVPMRPLGAWVGHMGATIFRAESLAEHLPLTLIGDDAEMTVDWLPEEEALLVQELRGQRGKPLRDFEVELQADGEVVWSRGSEAGRVLIPLAELEEALSEGADTLVLRVYEEAR